MRKSRKTKKNKSPFFFTKKTTTTNKSSTVAADDAAARGGGGGGAKFFGCYLLASLSPRHKGHTYIGFTVNPKRRIRQHNGEITSGASKTKRKRPWEMVLCIHGFPTNISALQFEWAWQHPRESVSVREIATSFKTIGGLANKIKLALTMLTLPSWQSMDLTVSIFSTNYMKHTVGCPTLPRQMKVRFSSLDDLPCYSNPNYLCVSDNDDNDDDYDDTHFHGSHHLNETQEFGFVETDPSTDISSYTLQNTPEPELVLEHQPVDRSLDEQDQCVADVCDLRDEVHRVAGNVTSFGSYNFSNTIFPTLRKHVNSSTENNLDECTSPTTLEEPFGSYNFSNKIFPTLRKHVNSSTENNLDECTSPTTLEEPFGSYNFSNNIFPTLKKHVNSSTENNSEEYTRPTIEEPFRQPPHFMRDQLSTADYVLIEESPREKRQAASKNPSTSSTDMIGASCSTEIEPIEVIDLYTPSPNYGDIGFSKKRKFPSSYSNFIDLTNSPVFLEQ